MKRTTMSNNIKTCCYYCHYDDNLGELSSDDRDFCHRQQCRLQDYWGTYNECKLFKFSLRWWVRWCQYYTNTWPDDCSDAMPTMDPEDAEYDE